MTNQLVELIHSRHLNNMSDLNIDEINLLSEIFFVIVLYKIDLEESSSYQSLKASLRSCLPSQQVDLLICDNSPTSRMNEHEFDDSECFNMYYLRDSDNPGISKSYNRAVELASIKNKSWIVVLDQDTTLPKDAIKNYLNALLTWPSYPIYAPQVYAKEMLLSPCRYYMHRGSPLPSIDAGVVNLKGKNVVNSGLMISLSAYSFVGGYDEDVWLYFSDFVFFDRLKKHFLNFVVINCQVEHELSSSDYSDFIFALKRFTYYCQGAKQASTSNGTISAYLGFGITVGLRSILMCRRFNSISFLRVFFNTFVSNKL